MIARAEWANGWGGLKCRANEGDRACSYAECSRHYAKGNLLYEGQRSVALRVCVTRSERVAFLRRRLKNAECINRGARGGKTSKPNRDTTFQ